LILRLGHAELFVRDLAEARNFYIEVLGFVEAAADRHHLFLRGCEELETHTLTLTAAAGPGLGHLSFRVSDTDDLSLQERVCESLGLKSRRIPAGTERNQGEALRVIAPGGVPVEFYHDFDLVDYYDADGSPRLPMRHSDMLRGVPPTRIDHANLRFNDLQPVIQYWVDELGFSMSELLEDDDGSLMTVWVRRKPTTHDLALGRAAAGGLHHIAFLVEDGSRVVRAADLVADAGYRELIDFGPGRHGITNAFFLYLRDPSGNRIEIYANDYWKDLDRPPLRWPKSKFAHGGMLWWGGMPGASYQQCVPFNAEWP
jgi:catechol 2,3-dioxygenase